MIIASRIPSPTDQMLANTCRAGEASVRGAFTSGSATGPGAMATAAPAA